MRPPMLLHSYCHAHTTTPVHDDGSFFDDTVGPDHDGSRNGKNSGLGMYNRPCPISSINTGPAENFDKNT